MNPKKCQEIYNKSMPKSNVDPYEYFTVGSKSQQEVLYNTIIHMFTRKYVLKKLNYSLVQSKLYSAWQTGEPCVDSALITKIEALDSES